MVLQAGLPTIICMTLNKPDMAPNLAQAGVGISYWVADGGCTPFAEQATASLAAAPSTGFSRIFKGNKAEGEAA